jgi:hypothetical protein
MTRLILEGTQSLPEEQRRRVLERVPAATVALIESTSGLDWVPLIESLTLTEAIHHTLGDPHFRDFFSGLSERMLAYPLLKSFLEGAVRLFGLTPQAIFKWSTYAWQHAFRHMGRLTYQLRRESPEGGRIEMELLELPLEPERVGVFAESLAGTFDMFLRHVSRQGEVRLLSHASDPHRITYEVTWR